MADYKDVKVSTLTGKLNRGIRACLDAQGGGIPEREYDRAIS